MLSKILGFSASPDATKLADVCGVESCEQCSGTWYLLQDDNSAACATLPGIACEFQWILSHLQRNVLA